MQPLAALQLHAVKPYSCPHVMILIVCRGYRHSKLRDLFFFIMKAIITISFYFYKFFENAYQKFDSFGIKVIITLTELGLV